MPQVSSLCHGIFLNQWVIESPTKSRSTLFRATSSLIRFCVSCHHSALLGDAIVDWCWGTSQWVEVQDVQKAQKKTRMRNLLFMKMRQRNKESAKQSTGRIKRGGFMCIIWHFPYDFRSATSLGTRLTIVPSTAFLTNKFSPERTQFDETSAI